MRELSSEQRFVEDFGLFLEQVGFPRIAGRILGLLLVHGVPMHLEQIATILEVSRASVSTNTRLLIGVMLIEQRTQPGDRRTWFTVRPDAFRRRFGFIIAQFSSTTQLLDQGLAAVPPEREQARQLLEGAVEFHRFMVQEMIAMSQRWDALHGDPSDERWREISPDSEESR
ncbi:MAG TPA: hypothetical protein PKW90_02115 [Myxococcota bacterium]|nr:hypothetical protein [Myxococcota bacterium]